jgi:peptide/nickel transport system permease protein
VIIVDITHKLNEELKPRIREVTYSLYLLSRNPLSIAGLAITLLIFVAALFAPQVSPYDPLRQNVSERLQAPSWNHLFGTDEYGRDVFSRVLYGARVSLTAGLLVIFMTVSIGIVTGILAGYLGGKIDNVLMGITDMFFAFPYLLLAIAIAAALGPSLIHAMVAITVAWWPVYARLVRGLTFSVKENLYVEAARSIGATDPYIMLHHILPNIMSSIIITATMDLGVAIIVTADLSFLGIGAQPPMAELGAMVTGGRAYIMNAWWIAAFPGLAILLAVLGFNLLGDALRDIFDPRLRR